MAMEAAMRTMDSKFRSFIWAVGIIMACTTISMHAQVVNEGLHTGIGRWMDIPDNPTIALPVFTAETWVKCFSGGLIVTRDHPTGTPSDWQLWYEAARNRLAFITATSPPDSYFYTPDNSFLPNRWNHVALVVNGPAGTAKLYLNGTLLISPTFSARNFSAATGLAWGGYFGNSSGAYMNGFFDEAKYWNIERTPAQIIATKDIALPMNDRSGLMGYWRFCGNYADSSGNGNHGSPHGGVTIDPIPDLPFGINCVQCVTTLSISIVAANTIICIGGSTLLSASPGFVEYLWSTGERTRTITALAPGRYRVTVRDANGCIGVADILISAHPSPVVDAGTDTSVCANSGGLLIGSAASGGTPPYRYEWSPPTGLDASDIARPRATPSIPTVYRVKVTDANGCVSEDSVRVEIGPELWLELPDTIAVCVGSSVQLFLSIMGGTPPFTIEWTPPDYLSASNVQYPLASPPTSRMYRVTVRDIKGCSAEDSIFVDVSESLKVKALGDTTMCVGDTILLGTDVQGGTPPFYYSWRPPIGLSSTNIAAPFAWPKVSTTYFVRVTDSLGCSAEGSVRIIVSPELVLDLPDSVGICAGDSIRLPLRVTGGDGTYTYRWVPTEYLSSGDIAQPLAFPPSNMMFRIVVRDGSGCVAEDSILVIIVPGPQLLLPDTIRVCTGKSVQLPLIVSNAAAPVTCTWTPPTDLSSSTIQQPIASPKRPTMYRVRVVDNNGCIGEDSVYVDLFETGKIELIAEGPTKFCDGDSVKLTATPGFAEYRWILPAGQRITPTGSIYATAEGSYRVAVIDSNGCELISNVIFITRPPFFPIPVSAQGPIPLCSGDSVTLVAQEGYVGYAWKDSSGNVIGTGRTLRAGVKGRYTVTAKDSMGCPGSGTIDVLVADKPKPTIDGPRVVCINSTHRYISQVKTGYSYVWSVKTGTLLDPGRGSTTTINWPTVGPQRLTLWQTIDSTGCADSISILVTVIDRLSPKISTAGPLVFCEGDSVILRADGTYAALVWKNEHGDTVSTNSPFPVRSSGRYVVTVVSADGCAGTSDTVEVRVVPRPIVWIEGEQVFCEGDTATYTAKGFAGTLRWYVTGGTLLDSDTMSIIRVHWTQAGSGFIRLVVRQDGQEVDCPGEAVLQVRVGAIAQPWVTSIPDSVVCEGDSVVLLTQPGYAEYRWRRADGSVVGEGERLVVGSSGLYYVTVRDSLGCEGVSAMVAVTITPKPITKITGPIAVCLNTLATYCVPVHPTAFYYWDTQGAAIMGRQDSACLNLRWISKGQWTVHLRIVDGECTWMDSIVVVVGDSLLPLITADGSLRFCEGDSVILDAGAGYVTYEWSTPTGPATGRTVVAFRAGKYTVRVVDANGCSGTSDPIEILLYPLPRPVISGPTAFCPGDSIVLETQGSYLQYLWSNGEKGFRCIVNRPGDYQVEVIDSNGCRGTSGLHQVTMHPAPEKPVITRAGEMLLSTPAHRYQWHKDSIAIADATESSSPVIGPGMYTVRIWNEYGCTAESDPFEILPVVGVARVRLPHLSGAPGEVVHIPLELIHAEHLASVGAGRFEAVIRLDKMILLPSSEDLKCRIDGRDRIIYLSGIYTPETPILAAFECLAVLGDIASTPLTIESFSWLDADVATERIHGSFTLRVCEEGGERLFSSNGALSLRQNHPNPFNAQTTIEYRTIERGHVSLQVLDGLGRRIATLVEAEQEVGSYIARFDASLLPSGWYLCMLRTPSATLYRRMLVIK